MKASLSIEKFNINKTYWRKVRLGDVAFEPKESVKDAASEGIEHVVGLDHIDTADIHLRRSAGIGESTTFTKKFSKEDVLFGRRRAYLKKAAQAKFNGICSGDITVIRAKKELMPELLPFVVNNERFFDYAITHSAGGLSPRVKFKDLEKYEIVLPPLSEQTQLAELLWSIDDVVQKERETLKVAIKFKHSFRKEVFNGYDRENLKKSDDLVGKEGWSICPVNEVCHIVNSLRKPINKEVRASMKGEFPYYGPTSVLDHISEYRVDGEYVLIGEDGDHFLKYSDWNMTQFVEGKFNVNNHAHILKGSEKCLTKWIYYSLQHRNVMPHISKQGATRYKLNKDSLENIPLLVPPISEQHKLIGEFDLIEENLNEIKARVAASIKFDKNIVEQVF